MTLLAQTTGVLVVVASAEEVSRRIESYLRNAGHPLRTAWVTDMEDLEDVLRRNPPDMVLCEEGLPAAPHMRVIELCAAVVPDLPVVLINNQLSIDDTVAALGCGARDVVSCGDPRHLRHLELVVVREFVSYHHLRSLVLTRERLADFESRHLQLTSGTADAVAHVQEGILAWANPAFGQLLGYDNPDELAGQPLIDLVASEQQVKVKERLRAVLKGKHNGEPLELCLVGRSGPREVKAQLILGQQEGERVIEMLIRAQPDAAAEQPAAAPAAGAGPSPLSRRAAFLQALQKPIPEGEDAPKRAALLVVIDSFENLENRIGHVSAEEAAAFVASSVRSFLGPDDALFEFSPDEFALVAHRPSFAEIERFGEQLRYEISKLEVATRAHESHVTASVVVFPLGPNDQPEELLPQVVSEARKLSKKGGNQVEVMGETAKTAQAERDDARRGEQVRKAIEDNRLKLAYQSIASLEGEARPHFDVLVRMLDEEGREYHASEFLRAAQKSNLMRSIDRWVVARALAMIEKRAASRDVATLFVKLSEDTLRDTEGFVSWLRGLVQARRLKSDEIVFQIQEHALQNHIRKGKLLAQALVEAGAGVAIEHYGVGSNSAQLLEHVPVSFIKFHPSFTQNFTDRDIQKRLVTLLDVAKQKNIKTIVSHIEDANVMARLWQMGVNFVQGYHVQEPEVVLLSSDVAGAR
jgi:PAS domain S-box-containing protein